MRVGALRHYFWSRSRKPWVWATIVVFGLPFTMIKFLVLWKGGIQNPVYAVASAFLSSMVLASLYAVTSPLPWLWTGDSRLEAGRLRGVLQSFAFSCVMVGCIVLLDLWLLHLAGVINQASMLLDLRSDLTSNLVVHLPTITLVGWFIVESERTEREKHEAELRAKEAQWILLRGQLSPHFLFNALNGLAELVHTDPDRAESTVLDLAELYRGLLVHGDEELETLRQERMLVERYLAVEKTRLEQRLRVTWDWDLALDEVKTPPFLVQPLVENALKHGIAAFPKGGDLRISLQREGPSIRIQVANTGKPMGLVLGNGVGLRNLEARLKLAYGDRASFRLRGEGEWVIADLVLPVEKREGGKP
jgi:Histidine kinase